MRAAVVVRPRGTAIYSGSQNLRTQFVRAAEINITPLPDVRRRVYPPCVTSLTKPVFEVYDYVYRGTYAVCLINNHWAHLVLRILWSMGGWEIFVFQQMRSNLIELEISATIRV